ncbi:MAG: hypothetical protein KC620_13705 [Myxococcales bacterium]|nr:hypothetical protein [Myxococcales bacterium]
MIRFYFRRRGPGVVGTLLMIFVTLKLAGLVTWSWAFVLAPLWISAAAVVLGLLVARLAWGRGFMGRWRAQRHARCARHARWHQPNEAPSA